MIVSAPDNSKTDARGPPTAGHEPPPITRGSRSSRADWLSAVAARGWACGIISTMNETAMPAESTPGPALLRRIGAAMELSGHVRTVDKYRMQTDPSVMRDVVSTLAALLPPDIEVLVGLELGGVPLAVALSLHTGLPSAILRRSPKAETGSPLSGTPVTHRRVLLVTDMLQRGAKLAPALAALRVANATVTHAITVVCWHRSALIAAQQCGVELIAAVTPADVSVVRGSKLAPSQR